MSLCFLLPGAPSHCHTLSSSSCGMHPCPNWSQSHPPPHQNPHGDMGKTSLDIEGLWVSHCNVLWVSWVAKVWRAWGSPAQGHTAPVAAGLTLVPTSKWAETRNNWIYCQANLFPWDFQPASPRKHVKNKTKHSRGHLKTQSKMSEMVDASQSLGLGPPELRLSSRHCYVFPETHQPVTQVSVWEQEML